MCYKKTIIYIIFCVFLSINLFAQSLQFKSYNVNNGLSQSVIISIFQDSEGFIWIGTQDGLNRFDGYTFKKFVRNPIDTASISNNWMYSITEDNENNIWIGTKDGLNKYNKKTGKFQCLRNKPNDNNSIFNNNVYGLVADKKGNVYVNTPPVLNVINVKTGKINRYVNKIGSSTTIEDYQMPVIIDRDGLIWIASSDGLSIFDPKTKLFNNFRTNTSQLCDNFITALIEDHLGNIWIGTKKGLNKLNKKNHSITKFIKENNNSNSLKSNNIRSIEEDQLGNIWVGTDADGGGLHKISFDKQANPAFSFYNNIVSQASSISNDFVLSLFLDRSNVLWIGTLNGLNKVDLKKKKFNLYRKSNESNSVDLTYNVIASIFKDQDNLIWIGTWGKGLNIFNRTTGTVEHITSQSSGLKKIPDDYVHVIFKDSKQRIWIGTRNGISIYTYDKKQFIPLKDFFQAKNFPDFKGFRVMSIIEDKNHFFWIGTSNGLYKINTDKKDVKVYQSGGNHKTSITNNLIYSIIEDKDGLIWIGTSTGLNIFDPKTETFTQILNDKNSTNTLCDNFVVSLCEDSEGNIWIGTKAGVNKYNKKTKIYNYYSEKDGLPSNIVYEILEDNNKNLWFSTGNGLTLNYNGTNVFKTFDLEDGLQDLEFNLKASYKSNDGELFFGGMNGVNAFYPDSLKENNFIPNIVITNIEKENDAGKQVLYQGLNNEIRLTHNDYALNIEFAALEYTNSEKNHYTYKMEGLSDNWIETGNRHLVPFSKIPPGNYILHIKGSNNDKVWNEIGISIKIIVTPPWWRSTWAYIIYLIIVLSFIIVFIKVRELKLIKTKKILEQKVEERTNEINLQKEEILAQHEEIQNQRDIATSQRDHIARQNKAITDSIHYAQRIQKALLTTKESISNLFTDYLIIFKPKDIVSGDFYSINQVKDHIIVAVADCTGHGIPGAFMSMLGMSILNEILRYEEISSASEVLEELRRKLKTSLQQTGKSGEQQDGMDIAICAINTKTLEMQYAGANNSLWLFKNNNDQSSTEPNLIEIQADKQPVGVYKNEKPFTNNIIQLKKGDTFYIFSDGFRSQFGGEKGETYKTRRFRELITSIHHKPLFEQEKIFENEFQQWKGNFAQIDDVIVLGLKV